ncbi:hypothetical protein V5F77_00975 [Xanthobacter sp. DSM 24535]|uniref:hypothetical protein n=1 Tax=Roseixanthobacter psychrophilus TaxID=3119917 RepID=UPI003728E2C8
MSKIRFLSRIAGCALILAVAGSAVVQAQSVPAAASVSTIVVPGVGTMNVLSYKARFVSADPATRRVVLETPNGKRWAVIAPPLLGDVMQLANSRQLLIRVLPGLVTALGKAHQGTPGVAISELVLKDGLPGWPEDYGFREITITSMLVNIDKANGTISFEGLDGLVRTVKAANPQVLADLQKVELGDLCQITYYEGLAINAM